MLGGAPAAIGANAGPFSWGATESGANPVRRRGEDAARFFGGLALSFIAPPYAKRLGREQPEDVLSMRSRYFAGPWVTGRRANLRMLLRRTATTLLPFRPIFADPSRPRRKRRR